LETPNVYPDACTVVQRSYTPKSETLEALTEPSSDPRTWRSSYRFSGIQARQRRPLPSQGAVCDCNQDAHIAWHGRWWRSSAPSSQNKAGIVTLPIDVNGNVVNLTIWFTDSRLLDSQHGRDSIHGCARPARLPELCLRCRNCWTHSGNIGRIPCITVRLRGWPTNVMSSYSSLRERHIDEPSTCGDSASISAAYVQLSGSNWTRLYFQYITLSRTMQFCNLGCVSDWVERSL
jgi:hypothetical protein